jgi:protein-S-isoprenylcysteine O-methyltransferase Ste14
VAIRLLRALVGTVVTVTVAGAVLFGSAGRWDLPWVWAYLGTFATSTVIGMLLVDPGLIQERLRPGPGGQDYAGTVAAVAAWTGQHVLAGLDVGRYHWSDTVPSAVRAIALVAVAAALALVIWAMAVNRFFSSAIRIQTDRGHHLITSGPYAYVRHPAYAVSPLIFVGAGLALGSWLAALLGLLLVVPILRRTAREDRVLHERLEGYPAYARRVRYRLVPGVW